MHPCIGSNARQDSDYQQVVCRLLATMLACFWMSVGFEVGVSQGAQFDEFSKSVSVADGSLRDSAVLSIDRFVVVGDRGSIITTINGGRSWEQRSERNADTYHAVSFKDEKSGLVVGGSIEPIIGRSLGVVLRTKDGGETWERIGTRLPRLVGLVRGPSGQWIAWGDWSPEYGASVFVSINDGTTWNPVLVPTGHMQSVGVLSYSASAEKLPGMPAYQAMFIDRLGKVFTTSDWLRFEALALPTSPLQTYHFCKCIDGTWWIGGDSGVLYRSADGLNWEHSFVPGLLQDRELLTFTDMVGAGTQRWLVGTPGSVVWHSADGGLNWRVLPTQQPLPLTSIEAGSESLVVACGIGGRVIVSRNGGGSWSLAHEAVEKVAALNIASTSKHVAWDLLSFVQKESRRATSAIIVHEQGLGERASSTPETAVRLVESGGRAGLVSTEAWRSLQVSDWFAGARDTDLISYEGLGNLHSPPTSTLVRRLVQSIRTYRPEVIVTDCPESYGQVQAKLAEAVQFAIAWSGKPECSLYSTESGIPDERWTVARTLYRGTRSGGLNYPKSMLLQSSRLVMGEVLAPLLNTVTNYHMEGFGEGKAKAFYRPVGGKDTSLREPLDGLRLSGRSELRERSLTTHRTATILKTSAWFEPSGFVPNNNFNSLVRDRAWEERLAAAMKGIEVDSIGPVLLEIGIRNRQVGNWNLWASAMEMLMGETPGSVYEEAALLELMRFSGSSEIARAIASRIAEEDRKGVSDSGVSVAVASSPFAKSTDAGAVQAASFSHAPRRIALANSNGLPEYHRLLSKIPAQADWKRKEHRYGWLVASRYRSILASKAVQGVVVADYQSLWPEQARSLEEWKQVYQQEWRVAKQLSQGNGVGGEGTTSVAGHLATPVFASSSRPYLDGKRSDECWPSEPQLMLRDPWGADAGVTSIYLAHDSEFLYLFCDVLGAPGSASEVQKRERDLLGEEQEQVRVRIDTDRDYATWFEFAWGRGGETADRINDMAAWTPNWYIATSSSEDGWAAEIAIPKSELVHAGPEDAARRVLGGDVWAVSAIHSQPGSGARSPAPAISDRFQADSWTLFDTSLQPSTLPR